MTDAPIDPRYSELKAELETLRTKIADLESRPAPRRWSAGKRTVLSTGLILLSAMVCLGGLTAAGVVDPFYIDDQGNIHITKNLAVGGTTDITGKATVGSLSTEGSLNAANLTTEGKLIVQKGSDFAGDRHFFQDVERQGKLRVGAAWGITGIYAEGSGDIVVGSETEVKLGVAGKFVTVDKGGNLAVPGDLVLGGVLTDKPDYETTVPVGLNEYKYVAHGLGATPSRVVVWVKSDGTKDWGAVKDSGAWKPSGILSFWEDGRSYGVVVEEIGATTISYSTGNYGLHHSTRGYSYFQSGHIWIRAWK